MYVPAFKRWIFNAICLSFYSKFKLREVSAHKIIFDLIAPFCYELWAERNSVFLELIDQTNLVAIFSVEILIQLSREKKTFKKHLQNKTTLLSYLTEHILSQEGERSRPQPVFEYSTAFLKPKNRPETLQVPIFKYPL